MNWSCGLTDKSVSNNAELLLWLKPRALGIKAINKIDNSAHSLYWRWLEGWGWGGDMQHVWPLIQDKDNFRYWQVLKMQEKTFWVGEATGNKGHERSCEALRRSMGLCKGPQENIIEWGEIRGMGRNPHNFGKQFRFILRFSEGHG